MMRFGAMVAVIAAAQCASAAVFFDDFNGDADTAPNPTNWSIGGTSGPIVKLDGASNLYVQSAISGASQRSIAVTTASNFDPFVEPMRVQLTNMTLGGDPVQNRVSGFVALGKSTNDAVNSYFPSGGGLNDGVAVFVRKTSTNVYDLMVRDYVNGVSQETLYGLNGAPTGLTMDVDGAGRTMSILVAGTTFSTTGEALAVRALRSTFTEADMATDGALLWRVAVGAFNQGDTRPAGDTTTGTESRLIIDSISISPVPEPTALALLGMSGMLLMRRRR